jgi:hypothetical protein
MQAILPLPHALSHKWENPECHCSVHWYTPLDGLKVDTNFRTEQKGSGLVFSHHNLYCFQNKIIFNTIIILTRQNIQTLIVSKLQAVNLE